MKSAQESPWAHLWLRAIEWINKRDSVSVVEFGCGPGHLAELLSQQRKVTDYVGYDFSPVALAMAEDRVQDARFHFACIDLTKDSVDVPTASVVVCCEFLEHIEPDLEILKSIPAGVPVFFTVPMRDDPGHVRWFKEAGDVELRYSTVLDGLLVERLGESHYAGFGVRAGQLGRQ